MSDRPESACSPDDICEHCGEEMGESWGVTCQDLDGPVGTLITYLPIHSLCWWEQNPKAAELAAERTREAKASYKLERVEKLKKIQKAVG